MKVETFLLCDAATDYHGKLNILGAFDAIWAQNVPAVHPLCAIALRMRFTRIEEGEHRVRINIVDEDGIPLLSPLEAGINVRFGDTSVTSVAVNMIFNLQGLRFQKFGECSVDLALDGRHEASLPLTVNQIREQMRTGD